MADLTLPVSASHDGWSIESSSTAGGLQTADTLTAELTVPVDAPSTPDSSDPLAAEALMDDAPVETVEAPESDAPAEATPGPKKRKTADERKAELRAEINALTRDKHAARAEVERLRVEREALRVRSTETPSQRPETKPAPAAKVDPQKPVWSAYEADGKSWDEYADAKDAWTDARLIRDREEAKAEARAEVQARFEEGQKATQERAFQQAHEQKFIKAREEFPDYDDAVTALDAISMPDPKQFPFLKDLVRMHPRGAHIVYRLGRQLPPETAEAIGQLSTHATNPIMDAALGMDDPVPLLTYLAENPSEFSRLAGLAPRPALVALGSVIARLDGAKTGSPSPAPPVTSAAAPIRPVVGTRGTGAVAKSPEDLEFSPEYVQAANRQERERLRHL